MTTPASGTIALSHLSTEVGWASTASNNMSWVYDNTKSGQQSRALSGYYSKAWYAKNNDNCHNGNCNCSSNCGNIQCNQCSPSQCVNCNCDARAWIQNNCNCACAFQCIANLTSYNCNCACACTGY